MNISSLTMGGLLCVICLVVLGLLWAQESKPSNILKRPKPTQPPPLPINVGALSAPGGRMAGRTLGGVRDLLLVANALGLSTKGLREIRITYTLDDAVNVRCDYVAKPDDEHGFVEAVASTYKGEHENKKDAAQ